MGHILKWAVKLLKIKHFMKAQLVVAQAIFIQWRCWTKPISITHCEKVTNQQFYKHTKLKNTVCAVRWAYGLNKQLIHTSWEQVSRTKQFQKRTGTHCNMLKFHYYSSPELVGMFSQQRSKDRYCILTAVKGMCKALLRCFIVWPHLTSPHPTSPVKDQCEVLGDII